MAGQAAGWEASGLLWALATPSWGPCCPLGASLRLALWGRSPEIPDLGIGVEGTEGLMPPCGPWSRNLDLPDWAAPQTLPAPRVQRSRTSSQLGGSAQTGFSSKAPQRAAGVRGGQGREQQGRGPGMLWDLGAGGPGPDLVPFPVTRVEDPGRGALPRVTCTVPKHSPEPLQRAC